MCVRMTVWYTVIFGTNFNNIMMFILGHRYVHMMLSVQVQDEYEDRMRRI